MGIEAKQIFKWGMYILLAAWWGYSLLFLVYIFNFYPPFLQWDPRLPRLDKDGFNEASIGTHFYGGAIVNLIGPFQFLPFFRRQWKFPQLSMNFSIHKILGWLYCLCSALTIFGGWLFISRNPLVGGINMEIAFASYGFCFFVSGVCTFLYARKKRYDIHQYWAIAFFGMGIASWVYRMFYSIAGIFGYQVTQVSDFYRPLDLIFDWLFFVPQLIFAALYFAYYRCGSRSSRSSIRDTPVLGHPPKQSAWVALPDEEETISDDSFSSIKDI